jgi:pimeloyl-ACP methyl ester carboxylesterase
MLCELVSIETDTVPVDGAFYRPDRTPARGAVLLMHGNVGNFYSGPSRFLPERLAAGGFACLAFNRRGHDILVNQVGRGMNGGAFQTAAEGMADSDYAAAFVAGLGYPAPAVIGHSNGGVLAACFAAQHPETPALVLLSAHAGGPDTYYRDSAAGLMAMSEPAAHAGKARSLVGQGRGDELMILPGWWYVITAASLVDRIDNTPGLLAQAPAITCPSLAVRGSLESPGHYPMEEFAATAAGPGQALIMEGCDHFYTGREDFVAGTVADWLAAAVGPAVTADRGQERPTGLPR